MNIVFDFGGVVFKWDPELIAKAVFCNPLSIEKARGIFVHNDWLEFDRGLITLDEISRRSAFNTGLALDKITCMLQKIPAMMEPNMGTLDLIKKLKEKGHLIFALSNMPETSMNYFERNYDFLNLFNGMVISGRVHLLKPHKDIYNYLLDQYNLNPKDTIFIDDVSINLKVAADLGINTIKFCSPQQCLEELLTTFNLII